MKQHTEREEEKKINFSLAGRLCFDISQLLSTAWEWQIYLPAYVRREQDVISKERVTRTNLPDSY